MQTPGTTPFLLAALLSGLFLHGCAGTGSAREAATDGGTREPGGPRDQVVMAALSQIGTRYRYGAQSPGKALDCSALTQHAHGVAGVRIPRVSTDQRKAATPVGPGKLQPGDLVFFRIRPGLHHVGLMVDEGRFVHASTSRKQVRLSSIESDYWQHRLIGAGTYLH